MPPFSISLLNTPTVIKDFYEVFFKKKQRYIKRKEEKASSKTTMSGLNEEPFPMFISL